MCAEHKKTVKRLNFASSRGFDGLCGCQAVLQTTPAVFENDSKKDAGVQLLLLLLLNAMLAQMKKVIGNAAASCRVSLHVCASHFRRGRPTPHPDKAFNLPNQLCIFAGLQS